MVGFQGRSTRLAESCEKQIFTNTLDRNAIICMSACFAIAPTRPRFGLKRRIEHRLRFRKLTMATSKRNTWNWTDSVSEQLRARKNSGAVRWYVLVLPTSRQGHYQGNPARRCSANSIAASGEGSPPSSTSPRRMSRSASSTANWSARTTRCSTTTSSSTPPRRRSTG